MSGSKGARIYRRRDCAVFRKTDESLGGLSNMAPGFPVRINGVRVMTVEALYQASRFPHLPEVQKLIIDQHSPMTAKMVSKPHRKNSREDWDAVKVKVMRWCLRLKLCQHWTKFSQLLLSTGDRSIVEDSRKDGFWGAIPEEDETLVGMNVLGRLLMELREAIKQGAELRRVEPPAITRFLLLTEPLQVVDFRTNPSAPIAKDESEPRVFDEELLLPLFADVPAASQVPKPTITTAIVAEQGRGIIEGLQPYSEYKESEQKWLGRIPAHWSLVPNRALFEEVKDRNHPNEEMLSVTITRGIIQQKALLTDTSKKDSSNVNKGAYKLVQPGDIAYNKMRAWQGAVGASGFRGIISPAYVVMRPRQDCTSWYYHHLYRTPSFAKEAERWSYGITSDMWSLRPEHFKVIYSVQPPPDEQAAIVRFLEHASRKIDGFIRAKRKLIGLLNEQKQAIIHRAVTRGLDPHAPLKPSGIPWLGDIPQHWEMQPLKSVCSIQSGITLGKDYAGQPVEEYPYLRVANVQAGHAKLDVVKTLRVTKAEAQRSMLRAGDVLMTEGGDPDKLGRGCVWETQVANCLHQNHVFAVRPNQKKLNPYFLTTLMGMVYARAYFQMTAKQTTNLAATNKTKIGMFKVLLPPIDEQARVLTQVDYETRSLNTAIARTEREIALMQEYRTRLTADVVTGKYDVRPAAARLPFLPTASTTGTPDHAPLGTPEDDLEAAPVDNLDE